MAATNPSVVTKPKLELGQFESGQIAILPGVALFKSVPYLRILTVALNIAIRSISLEHSDDADSVSSS